MTAVGTSPPLTLGACAALACAWEAAAPKPGNVYRGADFDDMTFVDFLTSAAVIAPVIDRIGEQGVGATVLAGVEATRAAIGHVNTNLGILLLIAPLAAASGGRPLAEQIGAVLAGLTVEDCQRVYDAIRITQPGGLGSADEADVNAPPPQDLTLCAAMELAAERDVVARQYVNGFAEVFRTADAIASHAAQLPLGEAIVRAFLELLRDQPDTLIARKCGVETAQSVSRAATEVLAASASSADVYHAVLADFDFWLRSDGNRLNPGASADIVAAALFVLLSERRLSWPVTFYDREGA